MENTNYILLRIVFAMVLGIVLLVWPANAIVYLVITIGILFLIPGLIGVISYLTSRRKTETKAGFPIEGAGSLLFGLMLIIAPTFFVNILMYVLGILLIVAGGLQITSLMAARKTFRIGYGFYIIPVLILLAGIVVLFNPFQIAETTFMLLGITALVYGVSELIGWMKFRKQI